jgi:hypothetical protein
MFGLQAFQLQEKPITEKHYCVDEQHRSSSCCYRKSGNDFTHETVKHVTVQVFFFQEYVKYKIVRLIYVGTRENISDMMTKQFNRQQFKLQNASQLGDSRWAMSMRS